MAEVVLVPALRGRPTPPRHELADWTAALAAGLRRCGMAQGERLADRLLSTAAGGGPAVTRVADYSDLFSSEYDEPPDDPAVLALAEALGRGLLNSAAASPDPELRREARIALEQARTEELRAATGRVVAPTTEILNRNGWLAWAIVGVSGGLGTRLREGARYALEPGMRRRVRRRVVAAIGPDTRAVIAYGSGTVMAYEACHLLEHPLDTLITLGSPLGMSAVIYPHLEPQPPSWPAPVRRWLNVAHPDDPMADRPDIQGLFPSGDGRTVEVATPISPAHVHSATAYLAHRVVGRAVVEALTASERDGATFAPAGRLSGRG